MVAGNDLIEVQLEDWPEPRVVTKAQYARAKWKQLKEFGYATLTLEHTLEQLELVLAGKTMKDGLTVIGKFMEGEVKR
jgi:hypothetical protein